MTQEDVRNVGPRLSAALSQRVVVPMEGRAAFPKPSGRVSHPVSSKPISQGPVCRPDCGCWTQASAF